MTITPESVEMLLRSDNFGERLTGVNQLRQLEPTVAFELIQTAVADKNVRVRYAAVSQLATLGEQNLPRSLEVLRRCLLEDPESDVQAAAADALGALKLTTAFQDLQALYDRSSDWIVKFSIVAALGEMGNPEAFGLLERAIESENELVKIAAIGALGELGDDRAVPLLLPYVANPDWQIRHRVVQALSHFDQPEVRQALEQLSQDEMGSVAEEAKLHLSSL